MLKEILIKLNEIIKNQLELKDQLVRIESKLEKPKKSKMTAK